MIVGVVAVAAALAAGGTLVGRLASERLEVCHSLAFDGCRVSYTVTETTNPGIPGAAMTATAIVRGSGGAPASSVDITLAYPGQTLQVGRTNARGEMTATFTQQAGPGAVTARVYVPGAWLAPQRLVAQTTAPAAPQSAAGYPLSVLPLVHQSGAYSVRTASDAKSALASGYKLLESDSGDVGIDRAAAAAGGTVVDGRPASIVRAVLCPGGACHQASAEELNKIAALTRAAATSPAGRSSATVAWEFLAADMSGPLRPALARIHQTLLSLGDSRPSLCSFSLPLARPGDTDGAASIVRDFGAAVQNFDSSWCSAVAVANAPTSATSHYVAASYDWTLSSVLSPALAQLRRAGWAPATQPLIAIPDAFGWTPRIDGGMRYRPLPRVPDLNNEINAYCRIGAVSVVAYAWDDGALVSGNKPAPELGTVQYLRGWTHRIINHCARTYWHVQLR